MSDGKVYLTLEFEAPVSKADIERRCQGIADAMADGPTGTETEGDR